VNSSIELIKQYVRAANYLSVSQVYLQSNFLLKRELTFDDIKPRLLGHWGTCPGINFIYAHLNYLIKKHTISTLFVLGPGHGFPALQANLFLEGTLRRYYPKATDDEKGIAYLCRNFSWPYGFPSHTNPGTPGAILEGGELGYALSTAYGAALDNPDLLVACVIGDGEAETGPTATAWHLNKFLDPSKNGAVLPILHLNGYKISGPTIFGRMSKRALKALFVGYGYQPLFVVEGPNIYQEMEDTLELCYQLIKDIQHQAKTAQKPTFYHFPMIILKTPKGWTGIKYLHGKKIEGNNLSHQVVTPNAKTDKGELLPLERWLHSYHFEQLFDAQTGLHQDIKSILPEPKLRMGNNKHAYSGDIYQPLLLPEPEEFAEDGTIPGTIGSSSMRRAGLYLNGVFVLNKKNRNFRFFCPDEIYSNKLDALLQSTKRAFELPIKKWDKDLAPDGLAIEMLSEHSLQGLAQGYILTGRHAVYSSYEAFIEIISSMASQYAKFLKQAQQCTWRGDCASLNYILTSSGWRQEHNGFSHQNPAFVGTLLQKHGTFIKAYFPPDGNSTLAVLKQCLASKNMINIIVAGKTLEPRWLTPELAQEELKQGLMIWDFASDPDPDIVFAGIGDYLTKEALAAIDSLKLLLPEVRIRFVNVMILTGNSIGHCSTTSIDEFNHYFTKDRPVIFNYHGYPEILQAMLFNQKNTERFTVYGYIEEGSTTTPFDMQVRNHTSRYHLIIKALSLLAADKVIKQDKAHQLIHSYEQKLVEHNKYIRKYGVDPQPIAQWQWNKGILS
jgi:xylulose-5-phosphate/fructose-6-phosphate phosphoketolase